MTLIECFDISVAKNIAGCLHLRPEKVIFIGQNPQMPAQVERYRRFFSERGISVKLECRFMETVCVDAIAAMLGTILRQEQHCVIDVTGGDERTLIAVGMVLATLDTAQRQRVKLQKFDAVTGVVQDCYSDLLPSFGHPVNLSVKELIALHGGVLHPASYQPEEYCTLRDIAPLWRVVSRNPRVWNQRISALGAFESRADSKTQVFLPLRQIRGSFSDYETRLEQVTELLDQFRENGIIHDQSNGEYLEYSYTTELNRHCTSKAGNALEVKVLLEARALEQDGKPFFHDCQMGVHIDWDGIVQEDYPRVPETRNEIDVLLTRGLTPLFISCKNGDVEEEELYKLHTVASRFGGRAARKMLIVTRLQKQKPASAQAFIQRARDMGIYLVTDAASLTRRQWQEVFREAMVKR